MDTVTDTVNRVVNAASTALWGEGNQESQNIAHGDEPMSGVQGKGSAEDPYDGGNRDDQPDAPKSDVNTAPQKPKLEGMTLNKAEPVMTNSSTSASAVAEQRSTEESDVPKKQDLKRSTEESDVPKKQDPERSTEESDGPKKQDHHRSQGPDGVEVCPASPTPSHKQQVSKEALEGPQGPPPKTADEFKKETKEKAKKPTEKMEPTSSSDSAPSGSSKTSNNNDQASSGSGNSNGAGSDKSGKQSTMSKVKERLHKVAHPHHGNKA
ncbi:hypothetical protein N7520_011169 [Penicillium odoratum]|uniref:uncharacterized protein n=1 Tax=Penicillium odoratum TaxID=1167516 RepID=UPI002548C3C1|nr:uncharacterized protein N7520_011169 [Penicillium odoratum]KAJ5745987.1 hypothetical protein N7520_011169 [Penicillium odoratum]